MHYIIDFLLIAVVIAYIFISKRKGFVAIFIETVGFILALFISLTVSTPIAGVIYDKIFEPAIISNVAESVENVGKSAFDAMPELVSKNGERLGINENSFERIFDENLEKGTERAVKVASNKVIRPVFSELMGSIIALALLILLMILVKILAKAINKVFSLPIVGTLNSFLGALIGIPKGVIMAILFCLVVSIVLNFVPNGFLIFTPENLEKTVIYNFFMGFV